MCLIGSITASMSGNINASPTLSEFLKPWLFMCSNISRKHENFISNFSHFFSCTLMWHRLGISRNPSYGFLIFHITVIIWHLIWLWTHKGHTITCPFGWAMGCLSGVFWRQLTTLWWDQSDLLNSGPPQPAGMLPGHCLCHVYLLVPLLPSCQGILMPASLQSSQPSVIED